MNTYDARYWRERVIGGSQERDMERVIASAINERVVTTVTRPRRKRTNAKRAGD